MAHSTGIYLDQLELRAGEQPVGHLLRQPDTSRPGSKICAWSRILCLSSTMKSPAVSILGFLALCFATSGWWISSNTTRYHPVPGQWERLKPKGFSSNEYWQTLLPPNQSTQITFTTRLPIVGSYCFYYEAEDGPGSFQISAQIVSTQVRGRHDYIKDGASWVDVYPNRVCARDQGVRFQVTSAKLQTFRIARYVHQRNTPPQTGYWDELCPPLSRTGRCPEPIPAAASFPTAADINAKAERRFLYAGLLAALAGVIWIGPFKILSAIFPSGRAAAVKREIRHATNPNRRFEASVNQPYRARSKSTFHRKQDIDDLKDLITEARRNAEKIDADLRHEKASEREYGAKLDELDAAIARVKELKEELERQERGKNT